ncbi:Urea ABC-type transport system, periplasmic substrate-binding protein UrtA [Balamuthia mandrillaris]
MGGVVGQRLLGVMFGVVATLLAVSLLVISLALGLGLGIGKQGCDCEPYPSLAECPEEEVVQYVNVGVLHSLSGAMASSERPIVDATLLAINEINAAGGLNGTLLRPIIRDGGSDEEIFAAEATDLLQTEGVAVIFGCWSSPSRKAVLPVLEESDGLLFYPAHYEGLESHPDVVYTGGIPNQQVLPAVRWAATEQGWRSFALVGADGIYSRAVHAIIKDELTANGIDPTNITEHFLFVSDNSIADITTMVGEIVNTTQPDVILHTITGKTNANFFSILQAEQPEDDPIPVVSFSTSESDIPIIGLGSFVGTYLSRNYFQSLNISASHAFVSSFKQQYGSISVTGDQQAAAYTAVYLWSEAARAAASSAKADVLAALTSPSFSLLSPKQTAPLRVDAGNQHVFNTWYVGAVQDGEENVRIDERGTATIEPEPFPNGVKSVEEWKQFLECWKEKWNGSWQNRDTSSAPLPGDTC